jgi:hypothetical protein
MAGVGRGAKGVPVCLRVFSLRDISRGRREIVAHEILTRANPRHPTSSAGRMLLM